MTSKPLGHFVCSIQHTSMCSLLRSSQSLSRFIADERPLTLNVPMVKFERDRGPFNGISNDCDSTEIYGRELHLMALLMCICTARVHPFIGDRLSLASFQNK